MFSFPGIPWRELGHPLNDLLNRVLTRIPGEDKNTKNRGTPKKRANNVEPMQMPTCATAYLFLKFRLKNLDAIVDHYQCSHSFQPSLSNFVS